MEGEVPFSPFLSGVSAVSRALRCSERACCGGQQLTKLFRDISRARTNCGEPECFCPRTGLLEHCLMLDWWPWVPQQPLLSLVSSLQWAWGRNPVGAPDLLAPVPRRAPAVLLSSSPLSRLLGLDAAFHRRLLGLLDLGYKCRLRLPLFISAGFVLCHLLSNFVPRVEINVQVVGDDENGQDQEGQDQHEEGVEEDEEGHFHINVDLVDEVENGDEVVVAAPIAAAPPQGGNVHVEIVGELRLR